jgi:peroxiredoxin
MLKFGAGPALRGVCGLLLAVTVHQPVRGQADSLGAEEKPSLPESHAAWISSPPLSLEGMRGKGIVLYFFDEQSPECASRWGALQTVTAQYVDKPVLFIAVNSGTDPRVLQTYAQRYGVRWPLVADVDRSVESAFGVPMVTPQTSFHVKFVDAQGTLQQGNIDPASTIASALRGAEWRVDPKEVPAELRGAWRQVELGLFADAAAVLKRSAEREGPLQAPAKRLLDAVEKQAKEDFASAGNEFKAEHKWQAYKLLDAMQARYRGYGFATITDSVEPALKRLTKDEAIRKEASARDSLRKAMAMLAKGNPAAARRAEGQLKRIVEASPDTEAATEAKRLLARSAGS